MTEWLLGTIVQKEDGALAVLPDGAEHPLRKACPVPIGLTVRAGVRVLLCRYAGSCIIVAAYA